jgi:hypothetical protein
MAKKEFGKYAHSKFDSKVQLLLTVNTMIKVKGKVFLVPPLTSHHAMKAYWGVEVQLHPFFDSALDGCE